MYPPLRIHHRLRLRAAALLAGLLWLCPAPAEEPSLEYRIKAAFIYKFGGFVEWPHEAFESPDSPLTIGVIGPPDVMQAVQLTTASQRVNGRAVSVRKLAFGDPMSGLHILFITRSDAASLAGALAAARGRAVLTVTETEPPARLDSIINFVIVEDKVRFDIALPPADASGLKISARLLAVARRVIPRDS
jgi:hypothetical protein